MCSSVRFSFRVCIVFSLVLSFFVCVFCFFFLFFSLFYIFFFMFFFFFLFFFFFQAEDGIRDHCVTGVQTCAFRSQDRRLRSADRILAADRPKGRSLSAHAALRSEGPRLVHAGGFQPGRDDRPPDRRAARDPASRTHLGAGDRRACDPVAARSKQVDP